MSRPADLGSGYRLTPRRVRRYHTIINRDIFQNKLSDCDIDIRPLKSAWGQCLGYQDQNNLYCKIQLVENWPFEQFAIAALAHEMCHQYQWEIFSARRIRHGQPTIMSHGPSFFQWRDRLIKFGIPLHGFMHHPRVFFERYLVQ